jgi:hypothetical protein
MQCDIIRLSSVDEKYEIIAEIGKGTYGKVYNAGTGKLPRSLR